MNIRFSRIIFAFLLTALLLSACGGNVASKEPLRVEFTQWWPDYTLLIAKEKGLFDKYGVNVQPVLYAGAEGYPKVFTDLPEKKIDGGLLAVGDALVTSQSVALKVVAVYDDGGPNTVVALPEIISIADLKGKTIGAPLKTSYELFVRHMLASGGLSAADVKLVNTDPGEVGAKLASKEIAAGYVWDPNMAPGNHIVFQKSDAPGLFPDVIVFREEVVKSRPDDIRAFLKAWFEAVEWRKNNVEEARQIAAKYAELPVAQILADNEIKILNQQDNLTIFQPEITGGSFSLPQAAKLNAEFQAEAGFMPQPLDLAVFLDGSFLK
jgi:NitT/TauT family transport system substrate-binding protein